MAYNGSALMFGGLVINRTESDVPVATNEVLWLDPGHASSPPKWRVLFNRTLGDDTAPPPRLNAAATIINDTLWIFGGLGNERWGPYLLALCHTLYV